MTLLPLESLTNGIPVISGETLGFYVQKCMVCFGANNHASGVRMVVAYDNANHDFQITWQDVLTPEIRRAHADLVDATNHAGCAIALLLVRELTEYTGYEQSVRGTTIDYWLTRQDGSMDEDHLLFNHAGRLEVSGILTEIGSNTVEARIREKQNRLIASTLPTIVAVIEFGDPKSQLVRHA